MQEKAVLISSEAKSHLKKNLPQGAIAFLLSLKPDGCSGYQFDLKPVDNVSEDVEVIDFILHIPRKLMLTLFGLKVSLEPQANFGYKLKYELDQASDYCGCGKSFKIDIEG
jgi:Fe-S cluster assembly iron-binding protein IscA